MQGAMRARRTCPLLARMSTAGGVNRNGRVYARHGVESITEDTSRLYAEIASTNPYELEVFQSRRWSDAARDQLAALSDGGLSARDTFANGGDITELNMERLVDALLKEEGQSMEDYQRRGTFFSLIAEFFRQRRAYSAEMDEHTRAARTMQIVVDSILAEDGRSATDYNARAQFFAKSAEVFPFNAEDGQI